MVRMRIPVSSPPPRSERLSFLRRPPLWLSVLAVVAVAAIIPASSDSAPPAEPELNTSQAPGLRTLVIDPGHGGQAAGAVGAGGLAEKDITLDIAVRLKELVVRRLGLQVVLTREQDVDVPHDERTEKANYWQADLFVSIHANAYRLGSVRGPETYFLSDTASDARAAAAARAENGDAEAPVGASGEALDFILWDLAQTQHLRESSLFAETIQANLSDLWGVSDRGVKQAPFLVLKGATMPAVLVEVGYLSNGEDARQLGDPAYRQQIAEALYRSITDFRQRYAVLVGAAPDP